VLTRPSTLTRARQIALANGLRHVYTGNVHDAEGGTTFCPGCAAPLIQRDWHAVLHYEVDPQGGCPHCGTTIAGHFAPKLERGFGRRRIPVRVDAS
jgi:pyruvate formate lyase activating enzyme